MTIQLPLGRTPSPPYVHTVTNDPPFGLSFELSFVDGKHIGALWLFCDRYLCEACVGEA
ncbi:hypothetical protein WME73_46625 [Sorangium sp. So ce302]|uniref:hypothetical protein n=1 Tax=Sorangium sp. So ce302 TaxID=3133297 RepID=UPI003F622FEF